MFKSRDTKLLISITSLHRSGMHKIQMYHRFFTRKWNFANVDVQFSKVERLSEVSNGSFRGFGYFIQFERFNSKF